MRVFFFQNWKIPTITNIMKTVPKNIFQTMLLFRVNLTQTELLVFQGDKTCFSSKQYHTKRWINCKNAAQKCTVKQVYWIATTVLTKNIRENSFLLSLHFQLNKLLEHSLRWYWRWFCLLNNEKCNLSYSVMNYQYNAIQAN